MDKNNKKSLPAIDEQLMMNMMVDGVKKEGLQIPETQEEIKSDEVPDKISSRHKTARKEKNQFKKIVNENYGDQFLAAHSMSKRGDKSIYIRQEYHERLTRIVQVIGEDKIPLYAYLDNILEHHFDLFEKAITEDFINKFKPIF
jgi:hypothetical protein